MGFGNFKLEKNTWSAELKTVDATLFGSPSAVSCDRMRIADAVRSAHRGAHQTTAVAGQKTWKEKRVSFIDLFPGQLVVPPSPWRTALTVSSRDAEASRRALWSVAPTLVATPCASERHGFPQPHAHLWEGEPRRRDEHVHAIGTCERATSTC
jgi:hypothetical protein